MIFNRSNETPAGGSRLAMVIAAVTVLLLAIMAPVSAQTTETETSESESTDVDTRPRTFTPQLQRLRADFHTTNSSTVVRGMFWVRVLFTDNSGGGTIAPSATGGLTAERLSLTNASLVRIVPHNRHDHVKYLELMADEGATSVTVSIPDGAIEDANGNTNAVGSVTYTAEPALVATLSVAEEQPILDGSFSVNFQHNYGVVTTHTANDARAIETPDFSLSHGRWPRGISIRGGHFSLPVSGYGSYVGNVTINIPANGYTINERGHSDLHWNVASNTLEVFVGAPFSISGGSTFVRAADLLTPVGTYSVPESAGTVTWSLSGDDSDDFTFDSGTGQLSFVSVRDADNPTDEGADNVYNVTVNAHSDDHSYVEEWGAGFTARKDVGVKIGARTVVSSVEISSHGGTGDTYAIGHYVEATVTFDGPVVVAASETNPELELVIGAETVSASYDRLDGDDSLVFVYRVALGDEDTDGVAIAADSLRLNGGSITDADGIAVDLGHDAVEADAGHMVDGVKPMIESVHFGLEPAFVEETIPDVEIGSRTYGRDEIIPVRVVFSEAVSYRVSGNNPNSSPYLLLNVGGEVRRAAYERIDDKTMFLNYTVAKGDVDADGISIDADTYLHPDGGHIIDAIYYTPSSYAIDAVADDPNFLVSAPRLAISSVGIYSDAGEDNTYGGGDRIRAAVTFADPVDVTGTPQLMLNVGDTQRAADFFGNDNQVALFDYDVVTGDEDTDGISIDADSLVLNGGTINDRDGDAVSLTHAAVSADSQHLVSAPGLNITRVELDPPWSDDEDDTHGKGDTVEVNVWFDGRVDVTGTPQVMINVGGTQRVAVFDGDDHTIAIFTYTVVTGDLDTDGISIDADSVQLNGGTINDESGGAVTLTHAAVAADSSHKVSAPQASISSVSFEITGGVGQYLDSPTTATVGNIIRVRATFSERVKAVTAEDATVESTSPTMSLNVGGTQRTATLFGIDNTVALFDYVVVVGDVDSDGVSVDADPFQLNGARIIDATGSDVSLTLAAIEAQSSVKVLAPGGV